ncbi:MAG: peptide/nickel transport system substrate-binding protein [Gammaproteobacteria bacterium]|jgi:peptide/nickel transport system substrate-binding protein
MMFVSTRRHTLAILVSGALVAAACSGSDSADSPNATEAPATAAEAEPDEAPDDSEPADTEPAATDPNEPAPLEDEDQLTSSGEGNVDLASLEPVAGGEITFGLTNDGTGFDTTGAVAPGSIRVITALNDSLVGLDADANWQPNLAESLTPNDDFTSWTITMRPGLLFHDGEPVDGEAVRANLQAFKDSPTVGFAMAQIDSITAVDELSVRLDLSAPWAALPYGLVGQPGWMVSPSTIGTNETFTGTGPFVLESWTPGDGARVVRNPNYWRADEGLPYLDAINFKFLVDGTVKRQAFEAGDVQGYVSPSDEDILDFLDDDETDVWIGTAGANEYLWLLNTTAAPFDDLRVRQAVAHAIDKQFIIDAFRSGLTVPANGPLNPSDRWYTENSYPQFDPAAAQALVDEYEAEVGPIEFELSIEPNASVIEVAEVMMSFLTDVGIDGEIKEIGQGQSAITAIQDDFQAFSWFQFGSPDPDGDYVFFHSSGGFLNWTNLVSADIDAGLDAGRQNVDEAGRKAGYAQFLQALGDEVPMIWVDHLNGVEAAVTLPELHGIGTPGVLPDGAASLPMTNGSFFAWPSVWIEQ